MLFFERPETGESAVLVHLDFAIEADQEDLNEFSELVTSAGLDAVALVTGPRKHPHPKYLVGTGKLEQIIEVVTSSDAQLVVFNHALTAAQQRNLEEKIDRRVIDRTGLILDIFAQRARTHEGKLQVELAQLDHLSSRLVRGWSHLDRQKGGIGLRGTGETQLEADQRLIADRLKTIHKRLAKVRKQREQGRRARGKAGVPTISLVGYTNAGKSTLFNQLTDARVYAKDQLFATLDPTLRRLPLEALGEAILADTVGFIRHLPHKLIEAFRATLQEAEQADLLLHVVDAASDERIAQIEQVNTVLTEIGADQGLQLLVYNKIDLLQCGPSVERDAQGKPVKVWVSAKQNKGMELLRSVISELLASDMVQGILPLLPAQGRMRAQLYQHSAVLAETLDDDGVTQLHIRLQQHDLKRMLKHNGIAGDAFRAEKYQALVAGAVQGA